MTEGILQALVGQAVADRRRALVQTPGTVLVGQLPRDDIEEVAGNPRIGQSKKGNDGE